MIFPERTMIGQNQEMSITIKCLLNGEITRTGGKKGRQLVGCRQRTMDRSVLSKFRLTGLIFKPVALTISKKDNVSTLRHFFLSFI